VQRGQTLFLDNANSYAEGAKVLAVYDEERKKLGF